MYTLFSTAFGAYFAVLQQCTLLPGIGYSWYYHTILVSHGHWYPVAPI